VTKIERSTLCVHGHFSQPPRGNPLDVTDIGIEPDAAPYQNWNERIHETSYKPNAEIGNFAHISFSFTQGLLAWLERYAPDTYKRIVEADQKAAAQYAPAGNALATAYNHVILPLARKRDKRTQIIWGIAAFERHYGRKPLGFWLPEMAVDVETLTLLAEEGISYTILTNKQVHKLPPGGGGGPYRVDLPAGKSIAVFTRDDTLSTEISFKIHSLGGAGHWGRQVLAPARKQAGPLTLLATAGETFGHHFAGEEQFLHWLVVHEAQSAGYEMTTLDRYYLTHTPTRIVQIEERSTWGDRPGLTHWATGYSDGTVDTTWKGALRRALDNAASDLDRLYEESLKPYTVDPWDLRNRYLPALLAGQTADEFISENVPKIKNKAFDQLKVLLQAQRLTQRMYNSYTFTDNQMDGRQPRYAIACAAAALSMAQEATGRDLNDRLPVDLAVVTSPSVAVTGADMLQDAVNDFKLTLFNTA
jgi:alpha-amylase/alpha-mannosidase (GH57 family)